MKLFRSQLIATTFLAMGILPSLADTGPDQPLVQTGEYLAIAGNCQSCHTVPGGEPFSGGVPFTTDFGTIYSTNITPDPQTGIGRWTAEEFRRAMREGIRPDGKHLYPAFPYTAFTKLSDADVDALFAYFMTVPAVSYSPPDNALSFPFNQRWLMIAWNALFFEEERYTPDASRSKEWNRGNYLVEGLGHCGACHTPRNQLGAERTDLAHTGSTYLDKLPNGELRPWSAANLTSAPSGLGSWSEDELVAYLKVGVNSYATTFGPMNKVVMNSTRHLADADVRAMAAYLKSLPASEQNFAPEADAGLLSQGNILYGLHCGTCHQPNGGGADSLGPALAGNPVVQSADPASLINVILYGPELPDEPLPVEVEEHMEAYAGKLRNAEIAAIASYLRSAWGNRGGRVTVDQVEVQR